MDKGLSGKLDDNAKYNGEIAPERRVVDLLISRGERIAFAESCTGGLAVGRLVGVPDASRVLDVSLVTYSNEMKIRYLGVDPECISLYGVVSEQVAGQMAMGVALQNGAEVGVGISGIAGPSGATETKPVGMVCFGFFVGGKVYTNTVCFGNIGRNAVREASVAFVYERLSQLLS